MRGRHRLPPVAVPPEFDYPTPDETLMEFLEGMFTGHGAHAFRSGAWVVVDGGRLYVRAAHFDARQHPNNLVLQTDFVCVTSEGQHIIESFAGIGPDVRSALADACKSFQESSFHVLFVTLLDHPCEHVEREIWSIGGLERTMTFGGLRIRGELRLDLWPPVFEGMRQQIETFSMPSGLHWFAISTPKFPVTAPRLRCLWITNPVMRSFHEQRTCLGPSQKLSIQPDSSSP
jgi:hypothetical protein